jgi:hypothetical protein
MHYAWVVALVTFVVLLVTAGIRATPGILIVPLESEFHWSMDSGEPSARCIAGRVRRGRDPHGTR